VLTNRPRDKKLSCRVQLPEVLGTVFIWGVEGLNEAFEDRHKEFIPLGGLVS